MKLTTDGGSTHRQNPMAMETVGISDVMEVNGRMMKPSQHLLALLEAICCIPRCLAAFFSVYV